ncbi:transposase [Paenibacillus sp. LBL]|nr:transposase [Paenibacillus sp. LBL]
MATRVSYPVEVKMKVIKMRLAGIPNKEVMDRLGIRNVAQLKVWMSWYLNGEVKAENRYLKQQLELPKKYKELERRCR